MASIWDFLDSLPKRSDVSPEELAARRQGYADLYQGGLLARNRDQMPLSVQGAQATQDFLPVIGDALALGEAGEALSRGELAAAGLLGAGAAIGLVPGAGDALAKPVMAAGRRAADVARRIEVDPNALGSMGGNIRLRPEYVSPAQEVAGLLSSGRAADVTDEMLAKLTPKDEMELFELYQRGATGMDLPMDEASRMARMAERFDEQPLYHGTASDVQGFDNMQRGAVTKVPSARSAHWLTGRYDVAGPYADLASTKPVDDLIDASRRAEIDGNFNLAESLMAEAENLEAIAERGQNVMQVHGPRDVLSFNADGASYDPTDYPLMDKLAAAKSGGYDAVRINDFVDNADWGSGRTASHIGVFDPANIRSRFARFDPRLAHLRNLSAGVGGLGLLGMSYPQEEQY